MIAGPPPSHPAAGRSGLDRVPQRVRWAVLLVAAGVQTVALYLPGPQGPTTTLPLDKVAHFALFAVVAGVATWAGIPLPWVVLAMLLQAGVSELVQQFFLTDRGGDWADFAADVLGTAAGILIARMLVPAARR